MDSTIQAFRVSEKLEIPIMLCVDGFILTHLFEPIELPEREQVDRFLPPYRFSRRLDSHDPLTLGTLIGPAHFAETRMALRSDRECH